MNLKSTFFLLLLAGGCVGLYYKGREWAPKIGLELPETPAPAESIQSLAQLKGDSIKRIEITNKKDVVDLKADEPGKPLALAGNWPTRAPEVAELVETLTHLHTRFAPIPVTAETKLEDYGLAEKQQPLTAKIETSGATQKILFGQPEVKPGENPFTRPTYARVNDRSEILRLGPDVYSILAHKADNYRRRQLFPDTERIRFDEGNTETSTAVSVLTDAVKEIDVDGPAGRYALTREHPTPKPTPPEGRPGADAMLAPFKLADAWELTSPVVDRVDPVKLKAILSTVPDLWVEQFSEEKDPLKTGLDDQDKPLKLTLKLTDGNSRTLLIGKVARTTTKSEPPPPQQPGMPPMPPRITEENYYYAKLASNPQVFEIKGDKLADLFFNKQNELPPTPEDFGPKRAVDELRDPNLVRFNIDQVSKIEINKPDHTTILLSHTKADPKVASSKDRWDLEKPFKSLAESQPVNDLLRPLSDLKAGKKEILDRTPLQLFFGGAVAFDLALLGLDLKSATEVRITADGKTKTLYIGKHDPVAKKLYVRVEGQDRINVVSDEVLTALNKQARVYRSLHLFDLGENRVDRVEAKRGTAEKIVLQEVPGVPPKWILQDPVKSDADTTKASGIARDLGNLEAVEYVAEPLSDSEKNLIGVLFGAAGLTAMNSDGYGFAQPSLELKLHFAGPNPPSDQTLVVGKARPDKPDQFFAKLAGSATVFAINKISIETLNEGSVALLPLQLWSGSPPTKITIQKDAEAPYTLTKTDDIWKIVTPFESAIDAGLIAPLAGTLARVSAIKFEAHDSKELAKYGLDKPKIKLTFQAKEKGTEPDAKEETKERTLLIGNPQGPTTEQSKPSYFAKLADKPAIFLIPNFLFSDANKSALDLVSKDLLQLNRNEVTKIQTALGADSITLVKDGPAWKPEGVAFPLDNQTIQGFLSVATNLVAPKFADYGPKVDWPKYGLDDAAKPVKVVLYVGDKTHTISLGKEAEDKSGRYARVDALAGVAVLRPQQVQELNRTRLDFVDKTLFKFDPAELQAIHFKVKGKEFDVENDTRGWKITAPTKEKADQPTLEELADRLGRLRAERIAAIDVKDFAPFGLDKPVASIVLDRLDTKGKETKYTLKIGKKVDDKSPDRFAQTEGSNIVAVISGSLAAKLLAEPIAFRDHSLASFVNADKIEIETPTTKRTFTKGPTGWKMTAPVPADADDEPLRELHDLLAQLRAEEFVAEKADKLDKFGLDKPTHWKLFSGDKEVLHLLVGSKEKTGGSGLRNYAKLAKDDRIALLDLPTSIKLNQEYRKRSLWEPLDVSQANLITITLKEEEESFIMLKGDDGWADPQKRSEKFKNEVVTDFLDCIAGLKAERFITDKGGDAKLYGLNPPERTIKVTTPNGDRTLELGRLDDAKRVYVKLPDKPEILLLSAKDTERLLREKPAFAK